MEREEDVEENQPRMGFARSTEALRILSWGLDMPKYQQRELVKWIIIRTIKSLS